MTTTDLASIVGSVTGLITFLSFVPQAARVWRTKHTHDLSRATFIMLVVQSGGWATYGVMIGQMPIILTNIGVCLLTMSILAMKVRHG